MEVKIINARWHLVSQKTAKPFDELSLIDKKLFGILIACDCIIEKHTNKKNF